MILTGRGMDSVKVRDVDVEGLRFVDAARPCRYWSDGQHIVLAGVCRCGACYRVLEEVVARSEDTFCNKLMESVDQFVGSASDGRER